MKKKKKERDTSASAAALEGRAKKRRSSKGASGAEPLSTTAAFWRKICPELHVGDADYLAACKPIALPAERLAELRAQLVADGFFTLGPDELSWHVHLAALRKGVRRLVGRGWPATMLLVYDEAWVMAHQLSELMARASGGCSNSLDTLAWSVAPALGQAGFAPHRDRQPADVAGSFRRDGTPRYCTCWVALSSATPENSCMHMVPRGYDPGYDAGDDHSADAEDPLIQIFRSSDEAVQAVRACPLKPGGAVIFSHRTMHWGSKGSTACANERISISFGHSDPSFEEPYFASPAKQLPYPPIALRVSLASSQLISYHERFNLSLPLLRRFGATFGAHKAQFSQGYAEKIAAEYMAACHDLQRRGTAAATPKSSDEGGAADGDDDEADAALDDALDAMLDAQAAAEGNLYDDFDAECVGSDEAWESD